VQVYQYCGALASVLLLAVTNGYSYKSTNTDTNPLRCCCAGVQVYQYCGALASVLLLAVTNGY
jgi:hypothetical protein